MKKINNLGKQKNKILKVDYPSRRAMGYLPDTAAFRFSQLYFLKKLKTEFSFINPSAFGISACGVFLHNLGNNYLKIFNAKKLRLFILFTPSRVKNKKSFTIRLQEKF